MSYVTNNVFVTEDNADISDLEDAADSVSSNGEEEDEEEMMNIGEFVFNHMTAERSGSCMKRFRRRMTLSSKCIIKTFTIIDVWIFIALLFLSLFLLVQKNLVVNLKLNWFTYVTLVFSFIEGIICIWILKLIIESGYEKKSYLSYIIYRCLSLLVIMVLVMVSWIDHLSNPPDSSTSLKQSTLKYFMLFNFIWCLCLAFYVIWTTVIYSVHMSIVNEFYRIVTVIAQAHRVYSMNEDGYHIASGVPTRWVGFPISWRATSVASSTDTLQLIKKDANVELEIEMEKDDKTADYTPDKITLFQWPSELSDDDSYGISPLGKIKKISEKIPKGRKLTMQVEDYEFGKKRKSEEPRSALSRKRKSGAKDLNINFEEEDDEEDSDDKYGLDFLEDYHNGSNNDGKTQHTTLLDMHASPVSRNNQQKKISIKTITKKTSFRFQGATFSSKSILSRPLEQ